MGKEQEGAYKQASGKYHAISQTRFMEPSETPMDNVARILPRFQYLIIF